MSLARLSYECTIDFLNEEWLCDSLIHLLCVHIHVPYRVCVYTASETNSSAYTQSACLQGAFWLISLSLNSVMVSI